MFSGFPKLIDSILIVQNNVRRPLETLSVLQQYHQSLIQISLLDLAKHIYHLVLQDNLNQQIVRNQIRQQAF